MLSAFKKHLLAGFDVENNPFLYRRVIISNALLVIICFIFSIFIFINISIGNQALAMVDLAVMCTTGIPLYFLHKRKNIEFAAIFGTILLFSFLIIFSYYHKNESFGLVWTFCFPLFALPVLGVKRGLFTIGGFYLLLLPIAYLGIGEWNHGHWDFTSFTRFLAASAVVAYATYFFEASSASAYKELQKIRKKEKNYLAKLKKLSLTDQLTGLYNRRYFDGHFEIEQKKLTRNGKNLSLIMLDLDHFKIVNDSHGHQVGDQLLIEFAVLLQSMVRDTDFLARWGGEEFIILLPETTVENAENVAEKIRIAITEHHFEHIGSLSASFGVTEVSLTSNTTRDAIQKADTALYQAKAEGRNKVVRFSS